LFGALRTKPIIGAGSPDRLGRPVLDDAPSKRRFSKWPSQSILSANVSAAFALSPAATKTILADTLFGFAKATAEI
jgi:hypothetical protein